MSTCRYLLNRYHFKHWAMPLFGALVFYGGLMMAFELRNLTREIASVPGASYRWTLPILLTFIPETLGTVLPMAAVLGGLLGSQHLSEGSEMVASQGLGSGPRSVLMPWAFLASILVVFGSINAHWIVPTMTRVQQNMRLEMRQEGLLRALKPGEQPFYPRSNPGQAFWLAPSGELHQIEVSEQHVQHVVAKQFRWWQDGSGDQSIYLSLRDIRGSLVQRDRDSVLQLQMAEQTLKEPLPAPTKILAPTPLRYQPTAVLLKDLSRDAWVELSRRITLPLATAALLLVGLALGICHPRFHRGGALVRSLGVILLYYVLLKYVENQYLSEHWRRATPLFVLPWVFFGMGGWILFQRLRPHHTNRFRVSLELRIQSLLRLEWARRLMLWVRLAQRRWRAYRPEEKVEAPRQGPYVFARWTHQALLANWMGTMAAFLTLDLLIEFATLAGDLSQNKVSVGIFLRYWAWNLPPFLSLVFPMGFLIAGVLTFSNASVTHEWVALRAGGASLVRWFRAGMGVWVGLCLLAFILQAGIAPHASDRAEVYYAQIKGRSPRGARDAKPWMHLTSNGVLWYLERDQRWGFPLHPPGTAPVLMRLHRGEERTEALSWGGLDLEPGPKALDLLPARELLVYGRPDGVSTRDLWHWQRWAPEADRATLLWSRLLTWLAGPALLFAALSFSFPPPRQGRGQALGYSLIIGLVFTGAQMIFGDAARAGDLPAIWGVLVPMILCVGLGLVRLKYLRT